MKISFSFILSTIVHIYELFHIVVIAKWYMLQQQWVDFYCMTYSCIGIKHLENPVSIIWFLRCCKGNLKWLNILNNHIQILIHVFNYLLECIFIIAYTKCYSLTERETLATNLFYSVNWVCHSKFVLFYSQNVTFVSLGPYESNYGWL